MGFFLAGLDGAALSRLGAVGFFFLAERALRLMRSAA